MDQEESKRNLDPERIEQKDENKVSEENEFNSGGNASDYDGGHPEDSKKNSEGKIDSDTNKN